MKKCYTIALIVLIPILSYGQGEYFTTDSLTSFGLKLIDNGDLMNSRICEVKIKDKIVQYSPYEVKEYGFKNGRVYKSREIQLGDSSKKVFMECLTSGETTLLYYRGKGIKTFYLEKDSTLFAELPKKYEEKAIYAEQLSQITSDCFNVSDACKLVNYNKKSLSKLISRYNNCELKPFPFLKYGLFVGMIQSKLVMNSNISDEVLLNTSFENDKNLYLGLFVDAPINASDFSVFTSFGLYQSSFSSNTLSDSFDADVLINQTTIKVPLMIRYTIPSLNYRPFFNIGFNYSYNLRNESKLYKAEFNNNVIQFQSPIKEDLINDHQVGYACGLGIQYHLSYKRILFVEIRYNREYSMKSKDMFNKNTLEIISGINI